QNHGLKEHHIKRFKSNKEDHQHLFLLIQSVRRMGITIDKKLIKDANIIPGPKIILKSRPSEFSYFE
ncbi:MAG: hypothetical protein WBL62_10010, partial [Gallionella sp.]